MGKVWATFVALLTLMAMPLFAVMGAISTVGWLTEDREAMRVVRLIAPNVLDEQRFLGSPILVTIPLFTFAGYLMAESKTPDRLVRFSSALLGWLPGGLAIVCIAANGFFTTMTGGSGVTIVAIGGMLYPVLIKQGYPERYALGLVTAAGAVGLLFFPSPLVAVYSFIAGVDMDKAYLATFFPGLALALVLAGHAVLVGIREKVPRGKLDLREAVVGAWDAKWDIAAPFLVAGGLVTGLMGIDEASAAAALYVLIVQVYVYKDLKWKDVARIARESVALAGAILIIIMMATALTNWVINERVPSRILEYFTANGMDTAWEFIIVLNVFLFILGVVMDEFSAMLVALPLVMPLAARFGLSPFHLAVMFLLNIEIAYISPPIGVNLYIASFRFNAPLARVYRVVMPFVWLLTGGLLIFVLFPKLSTFLIDPTIASLKAKAKKENLPATEAWLLECVQEDKTALQPCDPAERKKLEDERNALAAEEDDGQKFDPTAPISSAEATKPVRAGGLTKKEERDLFDEMLNAGEESAAPSASASAPPAPSASAPSP
ncbi:MAG: TRAP transporter large permease [Polyangiaceae bacterium]